MNPRIYRLLRNNKEEGPFTSEELVQKNLRPYDLIWIDGRSAAWSYPGELSEFKMSVPLPGDNSTNQDDKQQSAAISPSVQAAIAVNNNLAQPVPGAKPRYKVSAAWSKIQTVTAPAYKKVMVDESQLASAKRIAETKQTESAQAKSLSWEEAWLDWEKEKTTTPPFEPVKEQKPDIVSPVKTPGKKYTPPLETKYEESLDSLKDKYIENILQQKTRSGFSSVKFSEFVLPTIALLVIFSAAYWLLHNTEAPASVTAGTPAKSTQPVVTSDANKQASNANDSSMIPTTSAPINEEKQNIKTDVVNEPVIMHAEDRKVNDKYTAKLKTNNPENRPQEASKLPAAKISSPASINTTPISIGKPEKKLDTAAINNDPKDNTRKETMNAGIDVNTGNTNAVNNYQPVEKETPVIKRHKAKSGGDFVRVPSYIEMSNGLASLNIQNISDINLDLVVIDLEYYNAYNQFRKGETIYLHNLKAGRSVTVKTPKDMNSFYATSKISLVSSDAEKVYIVGDH
ncbi:MAG TPA: hypothetical protein VFW07_21605 [Parafilimonas sp.]|nr:hypothetical protein [Parafilimonas sp.]